MGKYGYVAKPDASESTGVTVREIPADQLLRYEESGVAPISELQSFFVGVGNSAEESPSVAEQAKVLPLEEFVAEEGGFVLAEHIERERDSALAAMKKRAVLAALEHLRCEACDFDFFEVYGEIGEGFCEVHHIRPLSERDVAEGTGLEDLAVLCSDCHSIIHRTSPLWTVLDLRAHLAHVRWSRLNDAVAR